MNLSSRSDGQSGYPKSDSGEGNLKNYGYNLVPKNKRVTMTLAGSDPCQDELGKLRTNVELECFIPPRTIEEERTDAPMPVRFFVDSRMTGIVGYVPRGLEPVVIEALARLESARAKRIPAEIFVSRGARRVRLFMGATR